MPTEDDKARLESVWKVHTYTNEYIRFADQKAGVFLAFQSGLLTAMFAAKLHHDCATDPFGSWVTGCASVAFAGLALGACLALYAVTPRLQVAAFVVERLWPWSTVVSTAPPGLIYWEQVIGHNDSAAYSATIGRQTAGSLADAVAQHTFVLASIAERKYRWVNRSFYVSAIPALLAAVAMFFHKVPPAI